MTSTEPPIRRREWAALAIVLALAAALRLGAPGVAEFKRDEGNLSRLALDLAQGRSFPLLGISSSVGLPNPPISVYLLALPYAVTDSPIGATLFVGALNVIGVGLTWMLARRYYGPTAALAAALLFAASPWGALYSRKIWAQNMLSPFIVATVFTGILGFGERRRWAATLHWPLLALALQIHYGAVSMVPLTLLMLALWRDRIPWRAAGIGLLLAALSALPALAGAYRDGWLTTNSLRNALNANPEHHRAISTTALDYAWLTVAGTDIHALAGPEQYRAYLDAAPDVYPLFKLIPLLAALSAGWLVWRTARRDAARRLPDLVLAAWLVLPVLLFTWEWTEVAPHYMLPLLPPAFVLCGAGFAAVLERTPRPRRRRALTAAGTALLLVVTGLQVLLFARLLDFVDGRATPGGFGTPLHALLDVREAVLDRSPRDVIVISEEEVAPFDEIPAVWSVLLDRLPSVRFVNGNRTAVVPAKDSLALIAGSPDLRHAPTPSPEAQRFERRPGETPFVLQPIRPGDLPVAYTEIEPIYFANGARLVGCQLGEGEVALIWRLEGPADADYQAFVHALDAEGARLAQADRFAWPGRYWRAGDTLILWFELELPPETAALFAGMYTTDGTAYTNVAVVDERGAYLDQGALIRLPG